MSEEKFKNLSDLMGKNVKATESEKSKKKREEKFFVELMEILCQIEAYSKVAETLGINLTNYENNHFHAIEMLLEKIYGEFATTVTIWWIFESLKPDGGVYPLIDENGVKHVINTPLQLYKFIKQNDRK
jgi:signal recognition particle GTPase